MNKPVEAKSALAIGRRRSACHRLSLANMAARIWLGVACFRGNRKHICQYETCDDLCCNA